MKEFDIEFEVTQKVTYNMSIKAESPEQAIKLAKDPDFDRGEAEEDTLLESYDDVNTIKVVGERVSDGVSSHREPFDKPIMQKLHLFDIYKCSRGNRCPFCDSEHIIGHPFEADDLYACREVECEECKTNWDENFVMTNIEKL